MWFQAVVELHSFSTAKNGINRHCLVVTFTSNVITKVLA